MRTIDTHVHIYPDKVALKATRSVGEFYGIKMSQDAGSLGCLRAAIEGTPIERCVVCSVAIKPQTVCSINDFIASECAADDRLTGLAAMHQDFEDPATELERAAGLGLVGVKLHPDSQGVNMDDDRLMRVYEACERMGMPLLIHCGDYRYDYSHPRRLKRILHEFPQLRVCAAHFGGWSVYDLALEYLEDERCFLDVSSAMRYLGRRRSRELVEAYGPDRIMFGSDFPMWKPAAELELFLSLGLPEASYERMCWHTAERWLGRDLD